jgi:DNA invertase Pin-like site-specific DNA recombinase
MRLLETLARVETINQSIFVPRLQQQRYRLTWGTTLIVITGSLKAELVDELYQARRSGQNPLVIVAGTDISDEAVYRRAKILEIPTYNIAAERDLKMWMQESRRT